jgi:hypothetical protein
MTVIALPPTATPTIVCPARCKPSEADHLEQLPETEECLVHYSQTHSTIGAEGHTFEVFLTRAAYTDGSPRRARRIRAGATARATPKGSANGGPSHIHDTSDAQNRPGRTSRRGGSASQDRTPGMARGQPYLEIVDLRGAGLWLVLWAIGRG